MTKMTKKEKFALAKEIILASGHEKAEMLAETFDHEIEMLANRKAGERKPTATQKQNEVLKEAIVNAMEMDTQYTVTEIIKTVPECAELTTQKVTAMMRQLEAEAKVVKAKEKGKTLFTLA